MLTATPSRIIETELPMDRSTTRFQISQYGNWDVRKNKQDVELNSFCSFASMEQIRFRNYDKNYN